jgi:magnesium transporter
MKKVSFGKLTWIDFQNPSADDIFYLQENFDIHPLAIEEFATPTIRPKATRYHNCVFLTVHIPLFDVESRTTYPGELDIVITRDHLITGHSKDIYQLSEFFNKLESSEGKRRLYMNETPAHLFYHIFQMLLESCFPKLDHIMQNLDRVEIEIFRGHEKEMVFEISVVKRDILNFRRTLKPQRSILESILSMDCPLIIPTDLKPYFQDLIGTNIRLWNTLENGKEIIESLEETNNSLLSNKLDMTMRILTVFSAILLPLTVYSNIMSMTLNIPLHDNPEAFWIHVGIMALIGVIVVIIFKKKKWM